MFAPVAPAISHWIALDLHARRCTRSDGLVAVRERHAPTPLYRIPRKLAATVIARTAAACRGGRAGSTEPIPVNRQTTKCGSASRSSDWAVGAESPRRARSVLGFHTSQKNGCALLPSSANHGLRLPHLVGMLRRTGNEWPSSRPFVPVVRQQRPTHTSGSIAILPIECRFAATLCTSSSTCVQRPRVDKDENFHHIHLSTPLLAAKPLRVVHRYARQLLRELLRNTLGKL